MFCIARTRAFYYFYFGILSLNLAFKLKFQGPLRALLGFGGYFGREALGARTLRARALDFCTVRPGRESRRP